MSGRTRKGQPRRWLLVGAWVAATVLMLDAQPASAVAAPRAVIHPEPVVDAEVAVLAVIEPPPEVVNPCILVTVPPVVDRSVVDAVALLIADDWRFELNGPRQSATVLRQLPEAGVQYCDNDRPTVEIWSAVACDEIPVPFVLELTLQRAAIVLKEKGGFDYKPFGSSEPNAVVMQQRPLAGTVACADDLPTIELTTEAPCPTVPEVEEMKLARAVEVLKLPYRIEGPDDDDAMVTMQDPPAGTRLCADDELVVVLTTVSCTAVPDVVDSLVEDATKRLKGFRVDVRGPARNPALVVDQSPNAGRELCGAGAVTLWTRTTPTSNQETTTTTTTAPPPSTTPAATSPTTVTPPASPSTTATHATPPSTTTTIPPTTTTTDRGDGEGRPPYQLPLVGGTAAALGLASIRMARQRHLRNSHVPDFDVSVHPAEPIIAEDFERDNDISVVRFHIESATDITASDDEEQP